MKLKERIIRLIKEPSTKAGIASALGGAAIFGIGTEMWTNIVGVVITILGTIASVTLDTADKD